MKLPSILDNLFARHETKRELFFSLILDPGGIIVQVWHLDEGGQLQSIGSSFIESQSDNWEEKIQLADQAIVKLEDKAQTRDIEKTVLGLPVTYLNANGDILSSLKPEIKKLTKELVLKPIGFVSMPQAIVHQIKKSEGVPPSVILIGSNGKDLIVTLYKIGAISGQKIFNSSKDMVLDIENAFKEFTDAEVLPSRLLLYGVDIKSLENLRVDLLKHPWTTRANFLHFPKVEIIPWENLINSVSLAGAAELTQGIKDDEAEQVSPAAYAEEVHNEKLTETSPAPAEPKEKLILNDEGIIVSEETEGVDKDFDLHNSQGDENVPNPKTEPLIEEVITEESNVSMVSPETLGFKANVDILEISAKPKATPDQLPKNEFKSQVPKKSLSLPAVSFPKINFSGLPKFNLSKLRVPGKSGVILSVALILLFIFGYLYYYLMPHATVTILEIPKKIDYNGAVIIDPAGTTVDTQNKIIPGTKLEQTVSGTKTIPVAGKKKVGDPAKGTVTVYNSNLTQLTLAKGAILSANSLEFALDSDVNIASASPFTKTTATANITAKNIGTEGNLSANTTFTVKGYSLDSVAAKNDQPLAGGVSREVTVVSRADQDNLVKLITADLLTKAKADLAGGVTGASKLIDETITTVVSEKTFTQELDQESTVLEGKVSIKVSGISYNETELKNLLNGLVADQIPSGYNLDDNKTTVSISSPTVKKDGKINLKAQLSAIALPNLDLSKIQKDIAGMTIKRTQEYINKLPGVKGVEFGFRYNIIKSRMPINHKNISVGIEVQL